MVSIQVWAPQLRIKRILFHTDYQTLEIVVNNSTSKHADNGSCQETGIHLYAIQCADMCQPYAISSIAYFRMFQHSTVVLFLSMLFQ